MKSEAGSSCPHCGAFVPQHRLSCPECGSDERTGWKSSEDIEYESVDIPDSIDELLGQDTSPRESQRRRSFMAGVAFLLIVVLILVWVF